MDEDSLTAISVIFEYGLPTLLVIFGYIAYTLSFNYFNNIEIHDFGVALMVFGIIFYFVVLVARGIEPRDELAPLRAISIVFAYGIPALLMTLGTMTYLRFIDASETELHDVGLTMLILGVIFYVIEMVARLGQRFSGHEESETVLPEPS